MATLATVYKILYMNMFSTLREVKEWSINGPPGYSQQDLIHEYVKYTKGG